MANLATKISSLSSGLARQVEGVFLTAGATTPLHYDVYDNLFQQLSGTKRFLLFPPSDATRLYLHPKVHVRYRQSQADLLRPDLVRFPLLAGLEGIEVVLQPGDLLFLPAFWFHHVEAQEPNYGLNVWFRFSDV